MARRIIVVALATLALLQLVFIVYTRSRRQDDLPPPPTLAIGDTVRHLDGTSRSGTPVRVPLVGASQASVVLAYDSKCAHCETVAPVWRAWLDNAHPARVIAITRDSSAVAETYRASHGWNVQVLAAPASGGETPAARLLDRTPWLYIFDSQGRIVFEGHGSRVAAVDSVLMSLPTSTVAVVRRS